jgi:hypothetical protein
MRQMPPPLANRITLCDREVRGERAPTRRSALLRARRGAILRARRTGRSGAAHSQSPTRTHADERMHHSAANRAPTVNSKLPICDRGVGNRSTGRHVIVMGMSHRGRGEGDAVSHGRVVCLLVGLVQGHRGAAIEQEHDYRVTHLLR